jgi:RNA polymerase-binding transcription factor DksA
MVKNIYLRRSTVFDVFHNHKSYLIMSISNEKTYYTESELKEFEAILQQKLKITNNEIEFISRTLSRKDDNGTDSTAVGSKTLEDGADMREKERLNQSSGRLKKFASQLEAALIRIKNGTYGICKDTGKLIPAQRLRAVPHTRQTIEAKLARK